MPMPADTPKAITTASALGLTVMGVSGMMDVKDFSISRLALPLRSDRARVIGINPGSVVTDNLVMDVKCDEDGLFVRDENLDVLKIASVERHKGTGNVGVGLIAGYGMRNGAVATSISHDSHTWLRRSMNWYPPVAA